MKTWPVQDAKARFSEFLQASLNGQPQIVTYRGVEAAVLLRVEEWRRLQQQARPDLKTLLLQDSTDVLVVPPRGKKRRRPVAPAT